MIRTKIKFEDIKAGDMLYVVGKHAGLKMETTGIAFEKTGNDTAGHYWMTSEGGTLIDDRYDDEVIYRLDLVTAFFSDIKQGDRVRVSEKVGNVVTSREDTCVFKVSAGNEYWLNDMGQVVVMEHVAPDIDRNIEILERKETGE